MLTNAQEKLIKSLQTKKGRQESGFCLVEGEKNIAMIAKKDIQFIFKPEDTKNFNKLVTTETPQSIAVVAKIPGYSIEDVKKMKTIVVLDNVQDPGNVGTILRLCLGFNAGLILVESVDPTSPKVIRASAGAIFLTPWIKALKHESIKTLEQIQRPVYRLENKKGAKEFTKITEPCIIIAGSEGQGIQLPIQGRSIFIKHSSELESLNVAQAVTIVLYQIYNH